MIEPSEENGYRRARPRLPTGIVVASVVIALVAVSGLILLLYEETRGPGEILRRFAEAVDDHNCEVSYDLLHESVRTDIAQDTWCGEVLPATDGQLDADFRLERAILEGDEAEVHVSGVPTTVWRLGRHGQRSWRILGPERGFLIHQVETFP
jgi:hypothetical protein